MKNALLVVYYSSRIWSVCDYMFRESTEWSKDNTVVCLLLYERPRAVIKELFIPHPPVLYRRGNVYYLRAVYLLPFQRFRLIVQINRWLFLRLVFPLVLKMIRTKRQRAEKTNRYFMFYQPEKEKDYFCQAFRVFRAMGYKTVFNLVDYPPTEDKPIVDSYRTYVRLSDIVVVNSSTLKKAFGKDRDDIVVVPQGFAIDEYEKARFSPVALPAVWPRIGFVGALGSRLDFTLLFKLIERNPQWRFVFWGPKQIVAGDDRLELERNIRRLLEYQNVLHGFSQGKWNVASVVAQLDIGIIPYDVARKLNLYCYPMKLFEYFYMGKPVVATQIEELKRFPKYVKIGRTAKEWEEKIKGLLASPWSKKYQKEQRKLAVNNSWEKKVEEISRAIAKYGA